jgi:hypothetical protein
MVKRHTLTKRGGSAGDDYQVGYGNPPRHTQYAPGQSGNPIGRRKGTRNLRTDVKRTLAAPVSVRVGDRMIKRSTQEASLLLLRELALRGKGRFLEKLLALAKEHNSDSPDTNGAEIQPLADEDQAILAAYVARTAGAFTDHREQNDESVDALPEPEKGGRK